MATSRCALPIWVPAGSPAEFTAGDLSSDGGVLLLRQVDRGLGLSRGLAACFRDPRDARFVDPSVPQWVAQRLYGLALGYEDLNVHAFLRRDPLLATACDKLDPLGLDRFNPAFRGAALAAPCTRHRLELSNNKATRCHKRAHDPAAVEECLLPMGVRGLPKHAREVVLDLEAMGHLLHGAQEGRPFSGQDDSDGQLPLYVFCGDGPRWAQRRLWLATFAQLLLARVRAIGGAGTELARATAGSGRLRLLQVAAVVRGSVRRVVVQLSRAWPGRELYTRCARALALWCPEPG